MINHCCNPIVHIIMFKLNDPSNENIMFVKETLARLQEIEFVNAMQIVIDNSSTEYSYDLAMIMQFDSVEDIENYSIHPLHKDFVVVKTAPYVQDIAVIDFSAEEALLDNEMGVYRQIVMFTLLGPVKENVQILTEELKELRKIPFVTKLVVATNRVASVRNSDMALIVDVESKDQMIEFLAHPIYSKRIIPKILQYVNKMTTFNIMGNDMRRHK